MPDINAGIPPSATTASASTPMALVSGPGRAAVASLPDEMQLFVDKHVRYIQSLDSVRMSCVHAPPSRADPRQRKDELEYWLTEHLRLNGLYWGLTALHLLGRPEALPRTEMLDFVLSCLHEGGGFGAAPGHDAHMLYTVSGVQILATLDAFAELEVRVPDGRLKIGKCVCATTHPYHLMLIVRSYSELAGP